MKTITHWQHDERPSQAYSSLPMILMNKSALDWPLCHCAMAQAPPSTNTGAPFETNENSGIYLITLDVCVTTLTRPGNVAVCSVLNYFTALIESLFYV